MDFEKEIMIMKNMLINLDNSLKMRKQEFKIIELKMKLGINDNIKIIDGYDYAISDIGNVYNLKLKKKLKAQLSNTRTKKYLNYTLSKNGKIKTFTVNKLLGMAFLKNDDPVTKKCVDHINGDTFDNRLENLRWVSFTQNSQNSSKRKNTSSIYKGVSFHKRSGKWQTHIKIHGKLRGIGYYDDEKAAGLKYNAIAMIHFGEYAKLNIIL